MITRDVLISSFALLTTGNPGLESFVYPESDPIILERLAQLDSLPLSKVQLNQLLGLALEIGVSDAFFSYYWGADETTSFDPTMLEGYDVGYKGSPEIISLEHLIWGLTRIYSDGLFFCGNVRLFFRSYAPRGIDELKQLFKEAMFDTDGVIRRGPALPLKEIQKDHRYLISEMACKSYGVDPCKSSDLRSALLEAYRDHKKRGGGAISIKNLLSGEYVKDKYLVDQKSFIFSADDILDEMVIDEDGVTQRYDRVAQSFLRARGLAMANTRQYLSMVNDLDVYVATSMRTRSDFRKMADECERIFSDPRLVCSASR